MTRQLKNKRKSTTWGFKVCPDSWEPSEKVSITRNFTMLRSCMGVRDSSVLTRFYCIVSQCKCPLLEVGVTYLVRSSAVSSRQLEMEVWPDSRKLSVYFCILMLVSHSSTLWYSRGLTTSRLCVDAGFTPLRGFGFGL